MGGKPRLDAVSVVCLNRKLGRNSGLPYVATIPVEECRILLLFENFVHSHSMF